MADMLVLPLIISLIALGTSSADPTLKLFQPFGFLHDGTENAHRNQGLLDQVLALKWIQQNIQDFGGDPHEVTLFGWSGGGTCIVFHMTSLEGKTLFKRATVQSGDINNSEVKSQSAVFNSSRAASMTARQV
ncbi:hypothetical protein MRX96_027210 [Rhipicephalus microplus]